MFYETLKLAVQAIRRNALRSFLTLLGIVIGVSAVIAMVTIGNGTTAKVAAEMAKLGSNVLFVRPGQFGPGRSSATAKPFNTRDIAELREQLKGIRAVAPWRDQVAAAGLKATAQRLREHGLALSGYCRGGMFTYADAAGRQAARDDNLAAREALLGELEEAAQRAATHRDTLQALEDFQRAWRKLGPVQHTVPAAAAGAVQQRQAETVARIEAPATLDGGDVLRTGGTAYVGLGGRTNGAGVHALAALLGPYGVRVQAVPVTRALHLKSACTALPDGTVVGWPAVVDDRDAFPAYEDVPEEAGAHVVRLGPDHLLMAASAPRSAEAFRARGYTVTEVDIGTEASATHFKVQREDENSFHLGTWLVSLGQDARYQAFQFSTGALLSRNQVYAKFTGEGSSLDVSGALLMRGHQHCDTTLLIEHRVPRCVSRELFKAVLDGEARGVFQGKIVVSPGAQKTDGKQMAQALLLSESAEFDSKPELEIFADDVVCGHGATSGQIDEDLLFYLEARGIPEAQARALLVQAFVGEALERIEHEALRDALSRASAEWLGVNFD